MYDNFGYKFLEIYILCVCVYIYIYTHTANTCIYVKSQKAHCVSNLRTWIQIPILPTNLQTQITDLSAALEYHVQKRHTVKIIQYNRNKYAQHNSCTISRYLKSNAVSFFLIYICHYILATLILENKYFTFIKKAGHNKSEFKIKSQPRNAHRISGDHNIV